jgi:hypothetical protein
MLESYPGKLGGAEFWSRNVWRRSKYRKCLLSVIDTLIRQLNDVFYSSAKIILYYVFN